jgi:hypothetical protein
MPCNARLRPIVNIVFVNSIKKTYGNVAGAAGLMERISGISQRDKPSKKQKKRQSLPE